ncbi:hypothetical protein BH09PLA1_BH09PLA1_06770 [soil metagenome]
MNADNRYRSIGASICVHLCSSVVLLLLLSGCGKPNAANIALRKENQDLQERIDQLEVARKADIAAVKAAEASRGTLPTLPQDRLDKLFIASGLKIGRLTGGARSNPDLPADDSLKIYVVPTDETGDEVKAAGSLVIEAFDLDELNSPLVGRWEFSTDEARKLWYGDAFLYEYVLPCPLKTTPRHDSLTVHITFIDELTRRRIETQKLVKLTLAPSPTTLPAVKIDP